MRVFLTAALQRLGYAVEEAAEADEAIRTFTDGGFALVIMDVMLVGKAGAASSDGIEVSCRMREIDPHVVIIIITAHGTKELAYGAIEVGAFDCFTKPFHLDDFNGVVRRGIERRRFVLEAGKGAEHHEFNELLGTSDAVCEIRNILSRVAPIDVTVLIQGESGTGKDVVAQTIHNHGPRKDCPFVALNCAAIPEELLESELFGHEKGAFTGATSRKVGKFELAHTGTIFLDEIGDMSPAAQAKTLRVIETQTFDRVGGTEPLKVDVRVIAATNKDLAAAIKEKQFRTDLFFRLSVFPMYLPPLRERKEDMLPLAEHFLSESAARMKKAVRTISPDAQAAMMAYTWPGNVRELKSCIERAVVMADGGMVTKNCLPSSVTSVDTTSPVLPEGGLSLKETVQKMEHDLVVEALRASKGSQVDAATRLGVSERTVWHLVKKHAIDIGSIKAAQ